MRKSLLVKAFACLLLSFFSARSTKAQNETNNWYFGYGAGLSFAGANPVPLTGSAMNAQEGVATISDANGQLLFYTNGIDIWNRQHQVMTNGSGLFGNQDATQSAVAVQKPGSSTLYYVFTVDYSAGTHGINYSVVDMSLSSGFGAVVAGQKNVPLLVSDSTTERITAVRHCNGQDVWFITRIWNSDRYYAWLLTSAGVAAAPVISSTGNKVVGINSKKLGYLKSSPSGTKLAAQLCTENYVELTSFNNSTGVVSNLIKVRAIAPNLPNLAPTLNFMNYGVEFSPNGNLLYANTLYSDGSTAMTNNSSWLLYQFNISSNDSTIIEQSRYKVDSFNAQIPVGSGSAALQLARNGKLYCAHYTKTALSVVNNPNVQGAGCSFSRLSVPLPAGSTCWMGLPNFVQSFLYTNNNFDYTYSGNCTGTTVGFTFNNPAATDSLRWLFGDPASAAANTTTGSPVSHTFSAPGTYTVKVVAYKKNYNTCESPRDTVTKTIEVGLLPTVNLGPDTSLCTGSLVLQVPQVTGTSYAWNTGATTNGITVTTPGTYYVKVLRGSCTVYDTIVLAPMPVFTVNLGPDVIKCNYDSVVLNAPALSGATYRWSTGSTGAQITAHSSGTYWLETTVSKCPRADTIQIGLITPPQPNLGPDLGACAGTTITLLDYNGQPGTVTRLWSTGATTGQIGVTTAGTYWLQNTVGSCSARDSVNVTFTTPIPVNLGPDKSLCEGQSQLLDASSSGGPFSYSWSTGATTAQITVTTSGTYYVAKSRNGCTVYDTVTLVFNTVPLVDLGPDSFFCSANPLTLQNRASNPQPPAQLWSTGSNAASIQATAGGTYWLQVVRAGCSATDTIHLSYFQSPALSLGRDTVLCGSDTLRLAGPAGPYAYLWNTAATGSAITARVAGTYWLRITDANGCRVTDTIQVDELPRPEVSLGADTVICLGDTAMLQPVANGSWRYRWQDSSFRPVFAATQPGVYTVIATNACGSARDEVVVEVNEDCTLFIADAFTPNGDGRNDVWRLRGNTSSLTEYKMMVADRWGRVTFRSSDPGQGWDGTMNGIPVELGTYTYYIEYRRIGWQGRGRTVRRGTVMVIR